MLDTGYALAKSSRDALAQQNYQVEWREYPMQHSVCADEVEVISVWLQKRFASKILLS